MGGAIVGSTSVTLNHVGDKIIIETNEQSNDGKWNILELGEPKVTHHNVLSNVIIIIMILDTP